MTMCLFRKMKTCDESEMNPAGSPFCGTRSVMLASLASRFDFDFSAATSLPASLAALESTSGGKSVSENHFPRMGSLSSSSSSSSSSLSSSSMSEHVRSSSAMQLSVAPDCCSLGLVSVDL